MAQLSHAAGAVLAACLLQACGGAATRPPALAGVPSTTPLLRLDDSSGLTAAHYYELGRYFQRRGREADAASAYQRSIALEPHQLDARNAQAVLLASQGRYDDAVALLRQVIADYPAQAQPRNNLGYVDHLRGDDRAAADALRQALRLDPGHAQARANLALVEAALARAPAVATPGVKTLASTANAAPAVAAAMNPASRAAPPAMAAPAGAAAGPAPTRAAPTVMPVTPSTMELVQTAAHEFTLQVRPAPTTLAAAPSGEAVRQSAQALDLAPQADAPAAAHVQIVNGNGVAGMGERVRRVLARRGTLAGASVVDQRRHYQRRTIIEYLPGHEQQARALCAALQGHALLLGARRLPEQTGIRVVLGRDLIAHIAMIDASAGHALAQQDLPPASPREHGLATPYFNQE